VDKQYIDKLTDFLCKLNKVELAYRIVIDSTLKFELAIQLQKVEDAFELGQLLNNELKY